MDRPVKRPKLQESVAHNTADFFKFDIQPVVDLLSTKHGISIGSDRPLNHLSTLLLNDRYFNDIIKYCRPIAIDLVARWFESKSLLCERIVAVFYGLSCALPHLPTAVTLAIELLQRYGDTHLFTSDMKGMFSVCNLLEIGVYQINFFKETELELIGIASFRFLQYGGRDKFAPLVSWSALLAVADCQHWSTSIAAPAFHSLCLAHKWSAAEIERRISDPLRQFSFDQELWFRSEQQSLLIANQQIVGGNPLIITERDLFAERIVHVGAGNLLLVSPGSGEKSIAQPAMTDCLPESIHRFVLTSRMKDVVTAACRCINLSMPVLLFGPSSAGKTHAVQHLAQSSRRNLITLHLTQSSDVKTLLGSYVCADRPGEFRYQLGVLSKAVSRGRWLLIEDLDLAPPDLVVALNDIMERGYVDLGGGRGGDRLAVHPDFRVFATITTGYSGGQLAVNNTYSAWLPVHVPPVDRQELEAILRGRFPPERLESQQLLDWSLKVYDTLCPPQQPPASASSKRPVSVRDLIKLCHRMTLIRGDESSNTSSGGGLTINDRMAVFAECLDIFVTHLSSMEERCRRSHLIGEALAISSDQVEWYLSSRTAELSVETSLAVIGRVRLPKSDFGSQLQTQKRVAESDSLFALTHQARALLEWSAAAIQPAINEPILLVGETGCGKTTTIQHLARMFGCRLHVVNMSQQSESSDLLGGYKPVDLRTHTILPLRDRFQKCFQQTFSVKENAKFLEACRRALTSADWHRLASLWRMGCQMAQRKFDKECQMPAEARRIITASLRSEWLEFEKQLSLLLAQIGTSSEESSAQQQHLMFSFVEGLLVQAVRQGDWILLDEINLASTEALECLSALLQSRSGSVVLADRGDDTPIKRHSSFRLFACMNPSQDVGKRELPPGLRQRFTERWVGGMEEMVTLSSSLDPLQPWLIQCDHGSLGYKDLVQLAENYLCGYFVSMPSLPHLVVHFYMASKRLADSYHLFCGGTTSSPNASSSSSAQKPHYSVRSLSRALLYARKGLDRGLFTSIQQAVYEGCMLVFCTPLSSDSRLVIQKCLERLLFGDSHATTTKRTVASATNATIDCSVLADGRIQLFGYAIESGPLLSADCRTNQERKQFLDQYIITASVAANMKDLARALPSGYPLLLQGPTSAGKTSIIEYLAHLTGNRFMRINNHEHTDLQELIGSYGWSETKGQLVFQEGPLVQALRGGYWLVLDELNLAPSDVLEALNRLLDDNRELLIAETGEVVSPAPGFMLFATQNPAGVQYGGRKYLSRAFRNRFIELHFNGIPLEELATILERRCRIAPSYARRLVSVYGDLQKRRSKERIFAGGDGFITLRDLFRWASRENEGSEQRLGEDGYMLLAERVRTAEEKLVVKQVLEKHLRCKIEPESLYGSNVRLPQPSESIVAGNRIVWTDAMRRLYSLVERCLKHREPVLLVGETGCGKTTVLQLFADHQNQRLHIVNCHQNSETADFIGSMRPRRLSDNCSSAMDDDHQVLPPFEWQDGALVSAMRNGDLFLLDEISLAEDSVLERLNSVLEYGRTLALAEKTSGTDGMEVLKAHAKFHFAATMNPGGDFGKKELSPALRNRFTEIWIGNAWRGEADVRLLISSRLRLSMKNLSPASLDTFTGYLVQFLCRYANLVTDGRLTDVASVFAENAQPPFSIRDIFAWIDFTVSCYDSTTATELDDQSCFLQAACLVFMDGMGMLSRFQSLRGDGESLLRAKRQLLAEMGHLTGAQKWSCVEQFIALGPKAFDASQLERIRNDPSFQLQPPMQQQFGVGRFTVKRLSVGSSMDSQQFAFTAPTSRLNALRVLRSMQVPGRKPILLEGPPGVGKTSLVSAIAKQCGQRLVRINLSEQTDLTDLFGCDLPVDQSLISTADNQASTTTTTKIKTASSSPMFAWRDGPFLQAMTQGCWVLLDEMNLASQSVLEGLNACLDHRSSVYLPELDKTVQCHPEFRVFAAQNPLGQGGGRKGLPRSFLNRFVRVHVEPFTDHDLVEIALAVYGQSTATTVDRSTIEKMVCFNSRLLEMASHNPSSNQQQQQAFASLGRPWEFNLRDVFRWLDLMKADQCTDPSRYYNLLYQHRFRTVEDRQLARRAFYAEFDCDEKDTLLASCDEYHLDINADSIEIYSGNSASSAEIGGRARMTRSGLLTEGFHFADRPSGTGAGGSGGALELLSHQWLPYLHSMMKCCRMGWMPILVGPAGSGKTTLVRLLAALAGRKLEEMPMNHAVDAMDLLGGFEQAEVARDVHKLRLQIDQQLVSPHLVLFNSSGGHLSPNANNHENLLFSMESEWRRIARLALTDQQSVIDCVKRLQSFISEAFNKLAANEETQWFSSRLDDLERRLLKSQSSNSGHFEWIDGVLVDAVLTGKWLLIDNANLCNPSVLDRLNSLLEPNGELVLSERGTDANGQLQVVRPHPEFRLFITVNSDSGVELSRAMRNRGVELFIPRLEGCWSDIRQLMLAAGCVDDAEQLMQKILCAKTAKYVNGKPTWNIRQLVQLARLVVQELQLSTSSSSCRRSTVADCLESIYKIFSFTANNGGTINELPFNANSAPNTATPQSTALQALYPNWSRVLREGEIVLSAHEMNYQRQALVAFCRNHITNLRKLWLTQTQLPGPGWMKELALQFIQIKTQSSVPGNAEEIHQSSAHRWLRLHFLCRRLESHAAEGLELKISRRSMAQVYLLGQSASNNSDSPITQLVIAFISLHRRLVSALESSQALLREGDLPVQWFDTVLDCLETGWSALISASTDQSVYSISQLLLAVSHRINQIPWSPLNDLVRQLVIDYVGQDSATGRFEQLWKITGRPLVLPNQQSAELYRRLYSRCQSAASAEKGKSGKLLVISSKNRIKGLDWKRTVVELMAFLQSGTLQEDWSSVDTIVEHLLADTATVDQTATDPSVQPLYLLDSLEQELGLLSELSQADRQSQIVSSIEPWRNQGLMFAGRPVTDFIAYQRSLVSLPKDQNGGVVNDFAGCLLSLLDRLWSMRCINGERLVEGAELLFAAQNLFAVADMCVRAEKMSVYDLANHRSRLKNLIDHLKHSSDAPFNSQSLLQQLGVQLTQTLHLPTEQNEDGFSTARSWLLIGKQLLDLSCPPVPCDPAMRSKGMLQVLLTRRNDLQGYLTVQGAFDDAFSSCDSQAQIFSHQWSKLSGQIMAADKQIEQVKAEIPYRSNEQALVELWSDMRSLYNTLAPLLSRFMDDVAKYSPADEQTIQDIICSFRQRIDRKYPVDFQDYLRPMYLALAICRFGLRWSIWQQRTSQTPYRVEIQACLKYQLELPSIFPPPKEATDGDLRIKRLFVDGALSSNTLTAATALNIDWFLRYLLGAAEKTSVECRLSKIVPRLSSHPQFFADLQLAVDCWSTIQHQMDQKRMEEAAQYRYKVNQVDVGGEEEDGGSGLLDVFNDYSQDWSDLTDYSEMAESPLDNDDAGNHEPTRAKQSKTAEAAFGSAISVYTLRKFSELHRSLFQHSSAPSPSSELIVAEKNRLLADMRCRHELISAGCFSECFDRQLDHQVWLSNRFSVENQLSLLQPPVDDATSRKQSRNFFSKDPRLHISELQAQLLPVLHSFQCRLRQLLGQWPENQVLVGLLSITQQILGFNATEPLMKFLVGLEMLLQRSQTWEQYAMKSNSLVNELNAVTELIVYWRKMELESWPALLDKCDEDYLDDIGEWWFRIYRLLLQSSSSSSSPPQPPQPSSSSDNNHSELAQSLNSFLLSSTVGNFQSRWDLIESFALQYDHSNSTVICNLLNNLCDYYRQFLHTVRTEWKERRLPLEREVCEYVRLASWKDTNADSLRQSAEKSHKTLSKLIRRYRGQVLAVPLTTLVQSYHSAINNGLNNDFSQFPRNFSCINYNENVLVEKRQTMRNRIASSAVQLPICERFGGSDRLLRRVDSLLQSRGHVESLAQQLPLFERLGGAVVERICDFQKQNNQLSAAKNQSENPAAVVSAIKNLRKMKMASLSELLRTLRGIGLSAKPSSSSSSSSAGDDSGSQYIISGFPSLRPLVSSASDPSVLSVIDDIAGYSARVVSRLEILQSSLPKHSPQITSDQALRAYHLSRNLGGQLCKDGRLAAEFVDYFEILDIVQDALDCLPASGGKGYPTTGVVVLKNAIDKTLHALLQLQLVGEPVPFGTVDSGLQELKQEVDGLHGKLVERPAKFAASIKMFIDREKFETLRARATTCMTIISDSVGNKLLGQHCCASVNLLQSMEPVEMPSQALPANDLVELVLLCVQDLHDAAVAASTNGEVVNAEYSLFKNQSLDDRQRFQQQFKALRPQQLQACLPAVLGGNADALLFFQRYFKVARKIIFDYLQWHRAQCKFALILCNTIVLLFQQGYCVPESLEANDDGGSEEESGDEGGKELSGTGIAEGQGRKDVSKEIEDEEQVLGLQGQDEQPQRQNNDEGPRSNDDDNGIEMSNDFDGQLEDVQQQQQQPDDTKSEGSEDELDERMAEQPLDKEQSNVVDEKLWNEDDDDDANKRNEAEEESLEKDGKAKQQGESELAAKSSPDSDDENDNDRKNNDDQTDRRPDDLSGGDEEGDDCSDDSNTDIINDQDNVEEGNQLDPRSQQISNEQESGESEEGEEMKLADDMNLDGMDDDNYDGDADPGKDDYSSSPDDGDDSAAESMNQDDDPAVDQTVLEDSLNDQMVLDDDGREGGEEENEEMMDEQPHDHAEADKDESLTPITNDVASFAGAESFDKHQPNSVSTQQLNPQNTDATANGVATNNSSTSAQPAGESETLPKNSASPPAADQQKSGSAQDRSVNQHRSLADVVSEWKRRLNIGDKEGGEDENGDNGNDYEFVADDDKKANDPAALADADGQDQIDQQRDLLEQLNEEEGVEDMIGEDDQEQHEIDKPNKENDDVQPAGPKGQQINNRKPSEMKMELEDGDGGGDVPLEKNDKTLPADEIRPLASNFASVALTTDESQSYKREEETDETDVIEGSGDNDSAMDHTITSDESAARKVWFECESGTHDLSMELCERLRLILEPTQATKLCGDYRTGKRLNMKKIIPYIASQYKKDKIWLRRNKPSKRQYHVLIAVDDSKSMGESRSTKLAYQTTALIARALSRLEVGQVGIVGFGERVNLLHSFDQPFTDECGVDLVRRLQFNQEKTAIKGLMEQSLLLLDRQRNQSSLSSSADIWQLEIIISDGLCENHDEVARLQRMARERNILVVFIMLDQRPESESLLATKNVQFVNGRLVMREYMDSFPFDYYVILRDIQGLPDTLSNALCQWFEILLTQ